MTALWNWLNSNSQVVSSVANLAMVLIWVLYLQIALTTFIRQRRPRIVIDQAHGHGIRSVYMVINLSQEPIHIGCVLVAFNVGEKEEVFEITDYEHSEVESDSDSTRRWDQSLKHGPLNAGEFLILGGIPVDLLRSHIGSTSDDDGRDKSLEDRFNECTSYIHDFELRIIGVFSTENRPIGASRKFYIDVDDRDTPHILPEADHTRQLTSRRDRSALQQWGEQCRSV